ncbi:MAG: glutathione S-transferase [Pseudomonadota bacterium]|nr:glutathione S-transferase [Pseudomonadota bacterium]
MPILHLGNRNYSSWSLRPWLVLRWAGIPFEENVIPLGGEGYGKSRIPAVRAVSPTGRVPALALPDVTIADSLAITEWAAEQAAGVWPADPTRRAVARSIAAEMHSGFAALRRDLSMNIRHRCTVETWPGDTRADIARVVDLVSATLARFGGPWLVGERSAADAFYAPIATRFRTYDVALPAEVQSWCDTVLADADFRVWEAAAVAEPWSIPPVTGRGGQGSTTNGQP